MKIRKRAKIDPIHLHPSDSLCLDYVQERGLGIRSDTLLKCKIRREIIVDEAVIFDIEEGDFEGADDGIGGAFLGCKEKKGANDKR